MSDETYGAFDFKHALRGITSTYGTINADGIKFTRIGENMGEGTRGGHDYKGRLTTRAQRIKAGWVGQILVDGTIVFEGKPQNDTGEGKDKVEGSRLALDEANAKLVEGFTKLFS